MKSIFSKLKKFIGLIINQDYLFSIVSKFTGVFLALIYSVFYNRYLGAALKGEAAIISNYINLISSLICLGMYQAYPFYKKKNTDEFYSFLNNMTSLYIIIFICSIVFSLFATSVNINLRVALCLMPLFAYIRHINYMVTIENPRLRNISSILINLTDLAVVVALWSFTQASYSLLCLILGLQTLINLIFSYANLKVKPKNLRFTLKRIPQYAKFGFVPMITLFLMTINYRIDILMLENSNCISLSDIGIYSVGVTLAEKVWLIPDAVKDILLSKLCKGKGADEVARVIRINLVVSILMIMFVGLLSRPLVLFVYGSEYSGADLVTIIILLGTLGMVFYKMVYSFNISQGKRAVNLLFLLLTAISNVIGNYFLIPILGIYGAALMSIISYLICGICFLIYFHRVSGIPYSKIIFMQKEDIHLIKSFLHTKS